MDLEIASSVRTSILPMAPATLWPAWNPVCTQPLREGNGTQGSILIPRTTGNKTKRAVYLFKENTLTHCQPLPLPALIYPSVRSRRRQAQERGKSRCKHCPPGESREPQCRCLGQALPALPQSLLSQPDPPTTQDTGTAGAGSTGGAPAKRGSDHSTEKARKPKLQLSQ